MCTSLDCSPNGLKFEKKRREDPIGPKSLDDCRNLSGDTNTIWISIL